MLQQTNISIFVRTLGIILYPAPYPNLNRVI